MVVFGQSGCIRKKIGCIREKWLYSGKVVVHGHSCCNRAKLVLIGQKCLYLGKSGSIWANMVVFGQIGGIRAKWF